MGPYNCYQSLVEHGKEGEVIQGEIKKSTHLFHGISQINLHFFYYDLANWKQWVEGEGWENWREGMFPRMEGLGGWFIYPTLVGGGLEKKIEGIWCWELYSKANHLTIVLINNIYELINNKSYLTFFIIRLHLLTNFYIVMKSWGLLWSIKDDLLRSS